MNESLRHFPLLFPLKGRSPATRIVFSVLALLVISSLVEFVVLRYLGSSWDRISKHKATEVLDQAVETIGGLQRGVRRVATDIAQHRRVLAVLMDESRDRSRLFGYVARVAREQQVGVEIYDSQGRLICWEGTSEPSHARDIRSALAGRMTSFVTRSPVFSQLFVAIPIRTEHEIAGAVLVRRTIEVNYPLSNNLIVSRGLGEQLNLDAMEQVEFNLSPDASVVQDGRYLSAVLRGIDSTKIGVVSVAYPSRSAYLDHVSGQFRAFNSAIGLVLMGALSAIAGGRLSRIRSVVGRGIAVTILIWAVRYLLLWLDLPSSLIHSSVFDPGFFASKFGHGLAKSIGELFLTIAALFVNVLLVLRWMVLSGRNVGAKSAVVRWIITLASAVLILLLLRGYAAVLRSAVFDSTLRYNDPMVIVPSFELAMMVVDLFLLSFSFIAVAVGLTALAFAQVAKPPREERRFGWLTVIGVYLIAAILAGLPAASPLVPLSYRVLFVGAITMFTFYLERNSLQGRPIVNVRTPLVALGLSAVLFYVILDDNVHERDRERMESYAAQVVKPSDSWLKFIVDEALGGFASEETANTLMSGDDDAIDRLAFDHWARSTTAREGYSCIFAVTDSSGSELSRFMIGGEATAEMYRNHPVDRPATKEINVHGTGTGFNPTRIYTGSIPIVRGDGRLLGYGRVVLAASQQTLFRGDSPSVLRSNSQESMQSFHRPITFSEFRDNQLLTSSTAVLPLNYNIPEPARKLLADSAVTSAWSTEEIDDQTYDTFYMKRPSMQSQVVALSMPQLGMTWHLVEVVKVLVYYAIVVLVFVAGLFVLQRLRGRRYTFTFRDKLLGALLVTALVPLIVMATYGRQFARDRLLDITAQRLEQETGTLGVSIEQRLQGEEGIVQEALSRYEIDRLADEAGTDFNLYVGNQLQASSRPELYEAGVLDKRLSGLAYANAVLKGKRFYVQTETIGSYEYAVGYRPLVSSSGRIVGIVSVPTLYQIEAAEEEIARQNALIFGVYAVVLFAIILIATTFANRIAAPIHRLTVATKKVARGELNVTVGAQPADGEIGELVRSFEMMTKELARSREDLVRFERDLAWKEMAKQVAHEIKNPLTPMKLSIQHLRQTYKDRVADFERVFNEVTAVVIEQIDTLSRIAGEFARFARMPKPVLVPVDVNAVLREAIVLFEQDSHIRFELSLDPDLPPVTSDREELRRAFINIIRNGIQSMNDGGCISIRSSFDESRVLVSVRDEGVGMSDEVKARLFEPNFSTKTEGMGLGLAITKKSIDDLGGTITVDSAEGKGTAVTISLPVSN